MKKRILASTFFCLVVLSLTACNSNIPKRYYTVGCDY